jgi:hypothetical protein
MPQEDRRETEFRSRANWGSVQERDQFKKAAATSTESLSGRIQEFLYAFLGVFHAEQEGARFSIETGFAKISANVSPNRPSQNGPRSGSCPCFPSETRASERRGHGPKPGGLCRGLLSSSWMELPALASVDRRRTRVPSPPDPGIRVVPSMLCGSEPSVSGDRRIRVAYGRMSSKFSRDYG